MISKVTDDPENYGTDKTQAGKVQYLLQKLEGDILENNIFSIKVDTNFDNIPMLKILEKLGYTYCGEVILNYSVRKAFEKKLILN